MANPCLMTQGRGANHASAFHSPVIFVWFFADWPDRIVGVNFAEKYGPSHIKSAASVWSSVVKNIPPSRPISEPAPFKAEFLRFPFIETPFTSADAGPFSLEMCHDI